MISKTREGARVPSREADFLEYTKGSQPIIGGMRDVGGLTVKQTSKGVFYDNVQSAIDDLKTISIKDIGEVTINTTGQNPQGSPQIQRIKFDGVVSEMPAGKPEAPRMLRVFGYPFKISSGDTASAITTRVLDRLVKEKDEGRVFKEVQRSLADGVTIDVTFLDTQDHDVLDVSSHGIQVTSTIQSPARNGYGAWNILGTQKVVFDGGKTSTMYFYERIA